MRVVVTGGAGFIGSHLADELVSQGHDVTILDDLSTGRLENIQHLIDRKAVRFVEGSVLDESLVFEVLSSADRVFHLAAAVGVRRIVERSLESLLNKISGAEIVLRASDHHKVSKVVVFSSSEVYGKGTQCPLQETDDSVLGASHVSRWGYAASKAVDEFVAMAYHRERDLQVVIVRCFNTCGPRQVGQYGMVVPRFVRQALRGEPLTIFGDGSQSRCFSYVGDVVRGVLMLADSEAAVGEVFNIGTDREVTIVELAERIRALVGSDSQIESVPYASVYDQPFEDVRRRVPDLGKIKRAVGYEPSVDLDTLLRRTIRHILIEDDLRGHARYAEFVDGDAAAIDAQPAGSWAPLT
jgi:UDP-glucose 4-epimerase